MTYKARRNATQKSSFHIYFDSTNYECAIIGLIVIRSRGYFDFFDLRFNLLLVKTRKTPEIHVVYENFM